MEMHQVRYFLAVANELNFTRAAEKCNVAQPSLTRAIKLLEEELGGPLFHRERANTHLSELGRMVRPHLEQVYAEAQRTKHLADTFTKMKGAKLKLGVMCTIVPNQIVDLLASVQRKYDGIELEIMDASAVELRQRLLEGELEVAIKCIVDQGDEERFHKLPLFRERMVIVVPPDHRLATRNHIAVRDLNGERYLERISCEFAQIVDKHFEQQGVCDRTVYRSDRDDWIQAMVAAGIGYAFMPEGCVTHTSVVARPLIEPEVWRDVHLVTVRGRPHSPAVGALVREAMRVDWFGHPPMAKQRADMLAVPSDALIR